MIEILGKDRRRHAGTCPTGRAVKDVNLMTRSTPASSGKKRVLIMFCECYDAETGKGGWEDWEADLRIG